jgi:short-subunit dehydrogenase
METNFFGPICAMKAIVPSMRENKCGVIVNVGSAEFWDPHAGASAYSASKFALEGSFLCFKPQRIHLQSN